MLNNAKSKAYHLLEEIKKFEGDKIITVSCDEDAISFDISEDGKVGYIPRHLDMCLNMIESGLKTAGAIVIRQFTNMSMDVVTPNGKMSIPIKKLYGIFLHDNKYYGLQKEAVRKSFPPAEDWVERTEVYCDCNLNG